MTVVCISGSGSAAGRGGGSAAGRGNGSAAGRGSGSGLAAQCAAASHERPVPTDTSIGTSRV